MTINELQDHLIKEIKNLTKDVYITDSQGEFAEFKGYLQSAEAKALSGRGAADIDAEMEQPGEKYLPYFVVRLDKVEYRKKEAENANQAHIFVEVSICNSDSDKKGFYTLVAVLEKVIGRFQIDSLLGPFWCERAMAAIFHKENEFPYCRGELEMFWNLPDIGIGDVS
ncbi:MAG: hypothetical protein LBQ71_08705 [Hungatella sp.]|jgi:hypothetical protein|nr:hypothetical protein [Hungatella sp.]